jgi:two-component system chemotaxis sensor kinase CheA
MLETDVQRLHQIIANLLSNAFKFTEEGEIKLIIERPTEEEAKTYDFVPEQMVAIRVADTGIGIPQDRQKPIFEAFQQVDGTTSRRYGGTGLGLSISKQLTKLLNGKLGLVSEENKGCTFTLYIPETPVTDKQTLLIEQSPTSATEETKAINAEIIEQVVETPKQDKRDVLKDKMVLVVDDDQRNVFAMTVVLDGKGMTTLSCTNGEEALAFLEKNKDIDIVLMDIMMPGMDGYKTIQKIREQPHFQKLPIIALTAKAMKGDKEKCIEAGASDYLTKPVSNERLISLIRVWLS